MADCGEEGTTRICETVDCQKPAKLQCPTCIKLGIQGSFFCSQECFKANWNEHKKIHKKEKERQKEGEINKRYNPWPGYVFTGKLRPFPTTPKRDVPYHIPRPDYADNLEGYPASEMEMRGNSQIKQLKKDEIESLRTACRLGREVLDIGAKAIAVGVTTDEIDRIVHEACIERNCYPSPLNYYNFPKSCCTSVNEVICHGIPDKRPLQDGDIVNMISLASEIDISVLEIKKHGVCHPKP
ncbi:methionine aminopeptidase 1-like [Saccoglossus kowalevskii]|uniref:Methionine aminopeptidase 1-like n=1 Tax=Saccoglossus kowalevskii TaxID=10224 RepID=A0ABM0GNM0_SACKO|nr:PREDICTED: methionine aminopeptidase 1-like [Saccoglossus kowalevskii]